MKTETMKKKKNICDSPSRLEISQAEPRSAQDRPEDRPKRSPEGFKTSQDDKMEYKEAFRKHF